MKRKSLVAFIQILKGTWIEQSGQRLAKDWTVEAPEFESR
jgi:hypothetical protein